MDSTEAGDDAGGVTKGGGSEGGGGGSWHGLVWIDGRHGWAGGAGDIGREDETEAVALSEVVAGAAGMGWSGALCTGLAEASAGLTAGTAGRVARMRSEGAWPAVAARTAVIEAEARSAVGARTALTGTRGATAATAAVVLREVAAEVVAGAAGMGWSGALCTGLAEASAGLTAGTAERVERMTSEAARPAVAARTAVTEAEARSAVGARTALTRTVNARGDGGGLGS